ncbi:unnamed protein product, partial [Iphiclides podalirius]
MVVGESYEIWYMYEQRRVVRGGGGGLRRCTRMRRVPIRRTDHNIPSPYFGWKASKHNHYLRPQANRSCQDIGSDIAASGFDPHTV